jgi:putative membrane protein
MKHMKHPFLLAVCCGLLFFTACSDDDDTVTLNQTDRTFMEQATYGNLSEKAAGQIAASKGMNAGVKTFGQSMVTDHGMAQQELDSIGLQLNVVLPTAPDSAHQAMAAQLNMLDGYVFDTTYMGAQVMDHIKTIQLFQDEINNGSHPRVRTYANKYLPVIQMHYNMADSIRKSLH